MLCITVTGGSLSEAVKFAHEFRQMSPGSKEKDNIFDQNLFKKLKLIENFKNSQWQILVQILALVERMAAYTTQQ